MTSVLRQSAELAVTHGNIGNTIEMPVIHFCLRRFRRMGGGEMIGSRLLQYSSAHRTISLSLLHLFTLSD